MHLAHQPAALATLLLSTHLLEASLYDLSPQTVSSTAPAGSSRSCHESSGMPLTHPCSPHTQPIPTPYRPHTAMLARSLLPECSRRSVEWFESFRQSSRAWVDCGSAADEWCGVAVCGRPVRAAGMEAPQKLTHLSRPRHNSKNGRRSLRRWHAISCASGSTQSQ